MDILPLIFLAAFCCLGNARADLKVTVSPSVIQAKPGSAVELPCSIVDTLRPIDLKQLAVFWKMGPKIIAKYEDIFEPRRPGAIMTAENLQKGNAALLLPDVQDSDAGLYTCEVIHETNQAEGNVELKIEAKKLHVQTDPSLVKAAVGDDVLLDCMFTINDMTLDFSLFSILWFHRGKLLAEFDDTVTVFKQGIRLNEEEVVKGNASLAISQVSAENSGKYRCYITYLSEVVIREATLQVDDPLQKQEEDLEEDSFLSRPCFDRSDILSKLDQVTKALDQLMATLQEFVSSKAVTGCCSDVASRQARADTFLHPRPHFGIKPPLSQPLLNPPPPHHSDPH